MSARTRQGDASSSQGPGEERTNRLRNASGKNVNLNNNADIDVGARATSEEQDNP